MKIIQIVPNLATGDAIGNDTIAQDHALQAAGFETEIYYAALRGCEEDEHIHHYSEYRDSKDNIVIYHLSTGHPMNRWVEKLKARLIIQYHNITPGEFFRPYNKEAALSCFNGLREAKRLAKRADFAIADSEFNKQDLIRMGYTCPIEVLPILIKMDDYAKTPDQETIDKYTGDGYTNLIFTGRMAPNKKQEDVIRAFYYYHTYRNPKSRLFVVGGFAKDEVYYQKMQAYINALDLADSVILPGHIPFSKILAFYRIADIFLCLSEHEGFCVPLVESMYFKVPIIAYDSTAIASTLGGSGLLLDDKDPGIVSEAIDYVVTHPDFREELVEKQTERLAFFDNDRIKEQFIGILNKFLQ